LGLGQTEKSGGDGDGDGGEEEEEMEEEEKRRRWRHRIGLLPFGWNLELGTWILDLCVSDSVCGSPISIASQFYNSQLSTLMDVCLH
jgi:hypothetical protein